MSRPRSVLPTYRKHRASAQAIVTIERREQLTARSKPPMSCADSPGTNRGRKLAMKLGECYQVTVFAGPLHER